MVERTAERPSPLWTDLFKHTVILCSEKQLQAISWNRIVRGSPSDLACTHLRAFAPAVPSAREVLPQTFSFSSFRSQLPHHCLRGPFPELLSETVVLVCSFSYCLLLLGGFKFHEARWLLCAESGFCLISQQSFLCPGTFFTSSNVPHSLEILPSRRDK